MMRHRSQAEYDEDLAQRLAALLLAEWYRVQRIEVANDGGYRARAAAADEAHPEGSEPR